MPRWAPPVPAPDGLHWSRNRARYARRCSISRGLRASASRPWSPLAEASTSGSASFSMRCCSIPAPMESCCTWKPCANPGVSCRPCVPPRARSPWSCSRPDASPRSGTRRRWGSRRRCPTRCSMPRCAGRAPCAFARTPSFSPPRGSSRWASSRRVNAWRSSPTDTVPARSPPTSRPIAGSRLRISRPRPKSASRACCRRTSRRAIR